MHPNRACGLGLPRPQRLSNWQLTRSRRSPPPLHQTAFDSARLELHDCSDVNLLLRQPLASFTPLPVKWPHPTGTFARHVSIVSRPTFVEKEWKTIFNMRRSEERTVLEAPFWMCVERECEPPHNQHSLLQETAEDVRTAMLGFQIWMPKGWSAVIVNSEENQDGTWRVVTASFPESYFLSQWAKHLRVDARPVEELALIIEGVFVADESAAVSAKNPFQYLEIGLQTAFNHRKAGALLWMIGLDALLAAQKADVFKSRLCRLLGASSYLFPRDTFGRQPIYKVGDVAEDIYLLRNQIAHGDRIRPKFMAKQEFAIEPNVFQYSPWERSYQMILCDAALFALCAALRRVIIDGNLPLLEQPRAWKAWLDK